MLHPGNVVSKNDGYIHFISELQLIRLYGVLLIDNIQVFDFRNTHHNPDWLRANGLYFIDLRPLRDGKYYNIHQYDEMEVVQHSVDVNGTCNLGCC